ncbi:PREDICTED: uncharacterized protein LOC103773390 [Merops nubicus]|uniref:uncharacterized protein LOC103773390 n=1 Tax=Merops nubicus TaxID=57421 RepID=UPI0004F09F0B|nr:PREDICTED: uncharacterized protein LOC103773390 [Merops nubicus]
MLGPILFNVFISGTDSGIQSTLSKSADDTNLSGEVDIPESIQRGLDKMEKWAHVNLMRSNKAKSKVRHRGRGNTQYQYRLGDNVIESSPVDKDLGIPVGEKQDMSQQCAFAAQKANSVKCIPNVTEIECLQVIVQVLVRSLVAEELIGQEQAGVSSHEGGWLDGEMAEQQNVPAILGAYGIKKKEEKEAEAQAALEANAEGSLTRPKKAIPPGCGDEEEEEEESILDTVIKYLPGPLQDIFKK